MSDSRDPRITITYGTVCVRTVEDLDNPQIRDLVTKYGPFRVVVSPWLAEGSWSFVNTGPQMEIASWKP